MNSKQIIGVTGYRHSGKDEIAKILCAQFGYTRQAFADELKWLAARMLHEVFTIYRPVFLGDQEGEPWNYLEYVEANKRHDPDTQEGWPRLFLQAVGMAGRDLLGDDFWVKQVNLAQGVVVTDVRLPNEAKVIHAAGGTLWRVWRPGCGSMGHASERFVPELPADIEIHNDADIRHLEHRIHLLMKVFPP